MSESNKQGGGFTAWVQKRPGWQRVVIFFGIMLGVIGIMLGIFAALSYQSIASLPRSEPVVLDETLTHSEALVLNEVDAYPAAVALDDAGTLYTGSYVSGAVWSLDANGQQAELPGTRDQIGSVTGLDVGADGVLYILDRIDPLQLNGAIVWRYAAGQLEQVVALSREGRNPIEIPNDIAVDAAGNIYVLDLSLQRIWRYEAASDVLDVWWRLPVSFDANRSAPAALAYDATTDALLVADIELDQIYALDLANAQAEPQMRYEFEGSDAERPGINGVDVAPDGTIYVAALGLNRVGRVTGEREITYLAQSFRGSSDVAYDAINQRLFVNNWDQRWLLPVNLLVVFNFQFEPRLPFSVDAIDLSASQ